MMNSALGVGLIVIGLVYLVANEPVVRWKRSWKPWWRDDDDPAEDAKLLDCLRAIVFVAGCVCVELGIWLSGFTNISWPWRVAMYGIAGVITVVIRHTIR